MGLPGLPPGQLEPAAVALPWLRGDLVMASRLAMPQSLGAIFAGYIDPRRTDYGGVTMRSRLEAAFARHLDAEGIAWRYEPAVYGERGLGYLPDFMLPRVDGPHFVEVKPTLREVLEAQRRMSVIWEAHPDAVLIVACAEGSTWFACEPGGEWESWVERWRHS